MAENIIITYEDKEYTLEYSRKTISALERRGLEIDKIQSMPMTMIPLLFRGAFLMHHPTASDELCEKIYETISDKEEFIIALAELYSKPFEYLTAEPDGKTVKNSKWRKG